MKKCGVLPLAIVILGGLLQARDAVEGWKEVQRDLISHLNKVQSKQQYEGVEEILALSYYDLPYSLKPCFLDMAFSRGYEDAQENVDPSVDCRGIYCTNSGREGKGDDGTGR